MKVKVSEFIADYFVKQGIDTIFTVVGGGAMHLNDSFGHHKKIRCIYHHHEQAAAMAAESYFRIKTKMAGVCVTSGPGAINTLTGVAGAYQDSIPMIVISGQTKTSLMTVNSGLELRTLGNQEFDIISAVGKMTKYAVTVMCAEDIQYYLEKAFFIAQNGRPGPTWLEIPVDIQGTYIETDGLMHYKELPEDSVQTDDKNEVSEKIDCLLEQMKQSDRPVIYAGNGIRISGAVNEFRKLVELTGIPVVTCWDSIDLIETDNIYFAGRGGIMGDRAGNFAVQNSDLIIAIGNRLNIYQVGYQADSWAREAFVVDIDIDAMELQKKTIHVDLPICMDAKLFIMELTEKIKKTYEKSCIHFKKWVEQCDRWKRKYPVVLERHYQEKKNVNVYAFIDFMSRKLPEKMITVAANGSASVVGSAAYYIKNGQRFVMNCAISSMGYELPAAIGACVANEDKSVICLAGDGSIMMNLQELQTIVTNHLPVKIVLINNSGYQQIRLTQTNLFHKNFVGIGPDSGDLGFPDFEKIAYAFGIPYKCCNEMECLNECLEWMNQKNEFCILEVYCTTTQIFEPKSSAKRLEDGSLYSPPLEDLAPFLSREELASNMYIEMWDERKKEK